MSGGDATEAGSYALLAGGIDRMSARETSECAVHQSGVRCFYVRRKRGGRRCRMRVASTSANLRSTPYRSASRLLLELWEENRKHRGRIRAQGAS